MNSLKWPLSDPPPKCAGNLIRFPKSLGLAPGGEQFYSIPLNLETLSFLFFVVLSRLAGEFII